MMLKHNYIYNSSLAEGLTCDHKKPTLHTVRSTEIISVLSGGQDLTGWIKKESRNYIYNEIYLCIRYSSILTPSPLLDLFTSNRYREGFERKEI